MREDDTTQRQRTVTEEPFALGEEVKGLPLASLRRRGAALLFDTWLLFVLATPLLVGAGYLAIRVQTPTLAQFIVSGMSRQPFEGDGDRATAELLTLVARRSPGAVPGRYADLLAAGDIEALEAMLAETQSIDLMVQMDNSEPSYFDPMEDRLYLRRDVIFGPFGSWLGYATLALAYFTLVAWIGRGRTPGKWLFGVRIVRLDGRRLGLLDAFGRAGGYAASTSIAGLGFVEARWDPNLQAAHDRLAGTVVIRDPRRSFLPWRWRRDAEVDTASDE